MKEMDVQFGYRNQDVYEKIRFQVITLKADKDSNLTATVTDQE